MRNPGRSDGDDARPDSVDSSTPQAGSTGAPADGAAGVPVPEPTTDAARTTEPTGTKPVKAPDAGSDLPESDLPEGPDDFDDDLLLLAAGSGITPSRMTS